MRLVLHERLGHILHDLLPKRGSELVYATSKSPRGPFEYRGTIVDNGAEYPGEMTTAQYAILADNGIFSNARMTNGTIMSKELVLRKSNFLKMALSHKLK